jgi:hypothetical protein
MARKPSPAPKPKPAPARAVIVLPEGPFIGRVPVEHGQPRVDVLDAGLRLIELLAADGAPQTRIASALGIGHGTFKNFLKAEAGDNPVRLAWEAGRGTLEAEIASLLLAKGRGGDTIALIYFSKAQLGWSEQPSISNTVGIQIVVPDSMDRDAFARRVSDRVAVKVITDETGGPNG